MDRYYIRENTEEMRELYTNTYFVVTQTYTVIDVETFETIVDTDNQAYAQFVCDYYNSKNM